jgi:hypothetical protein
MVIPCSLAVGRHTAGAVLAEMLQVVDAVRNWSAHFLRRS